MTRVNPPDCLFSMSAQKKFSVPIEFGFGLYGQCGYGDEFLFIDLRPFGACNYGQVEYADEILLSGVYAQRSLADGKDTIREKFMFPGNPRTEIQMANRYKFGDAVAAYQILGTAERKEWKRKAQRKQMSGYNLFLRQYMLS